MKPRFVLALVVVLQSIGLASAQPVDVSLISPDVLTKEQKSEAPGMIDRWVERETAEFNAKNRQDWSKITTKEAWEKYRDERIANLKRSLGEFPKPGKVNVRVTATIPGDGFVIENVLYESRPGLWVAGNLYSPAKPSASMPGILIAHAHHNGKTDSELQDMGMTWARAGCVVLVIDQFGYKDRRTHPFNTAEDFGQPYKTGRQDYYFRYDTGVQLQLLGDSLMGWFATDLMRGVDLLLSKEGVDAKRIILLGGVAGGGDPAGVTAALDPRIACVVPFNFGGPQPETKYPLPDDVEQKFNYLMFTYWDSTRGLRQGASGEFPHWLIVASVAPRHLIHAHEFSWDRERDPVWKRYEKIWGFYGAGDKIGAATGKGTLRGKAPESSHCNHIGAFHRQMIHPLFDKWFGIKATEYSMPRKAAELACWTDKAREELAPKPLTTLMSDVGAARAEAARAKLAGKPASEQRAMLRADWAKLLGPIAPGKAKVVSEKTEEIPGATVERVVLETEPGILVPTVVVVPQKRAKKAAVVVGLAHGGHAEFMKRRNVEIGKLLDAGVIVALPDVRGTGETRAGKSRGRDSADTNQSTHVQLFGETLLGQRLRDLRSTLGYLRGRGDVDGGRIALWGDSFAGANGAEVNFKVPHAADGWPGLSEPVGGLLALFGSLYEDDVKAAAVGGGLASYQSVLGHFAVLTPHGDAVPGALTAGDLSDVAASLAPRPLRLERMVDQRNQLVGADALRKAYAAASIDGPGTTAEWLIERVK